MQNEKKWTMILGIILFLQLVVEIVAAIVVLKLNMLPGKYVAVLIVAMVLLTALTGALAFVRIKGKVALWRRITACVLAILVLCACIFIGKIAVDTYRTVNTVTGTDVNANTRNTYVVVLQDDPAQSLADTKGYTFGIIENYDVTHTQRVIDVVSDEHGQTPEIIHYAGASAMADALYQKQADALIISGVSISFLIEEEAHEDFLNRVRILYTLPYDNSGDTGANTPTTPAEEVTQAPFVLYISGSDTRSATLDVSLSDVNILAVVNPLTKQILLLNTPRDYFVPNPAGDGALDKLTHCGRYGIDCSIQALQNLYGIEIDYYGQINFKGFEGLVDAIGGITFYSDVAFQARDNTYIKAGENQLTGKQALDVARERYHVAGGDNGRGKNQMKLIKAVFEKVTSSTTLISKYAEIMKNLQGMIVTSFRAAEISAEGKSIFRHDPKGKVAEAYRELTKEVLQNERQRQKHQSDFVR